MGNCGSFCGGSESTTDKYNLENIQKQEPFPEPAYPEEDGVNDPLSNTTSRLGWNLEQPNEDSTMRPSRFSLSPEKDDALEQAPNNLTPFAAHLDEHEDKPAEPKIVTAQNNEATIAIHFEEPEENNQLDPQIVPDPTETAAFAVHLDEPNFFCRDFRPTLAVMAYFDSLDRSKALLRRLSKMTGDFYNSNEQDFFL